MRSRIVRPYDTRAGNPAMYHPEASVLVPRDVVPRPKTPAFKSVPVEILPDRSGDAAAPLRLFEARVAGPVSDR